MVGILQFGLSMTFVWLLVVFFVIQALDGNLLVPLLFSEVLDMHPVGVVSAILIFGGMWGFGEYSSRYHRSYCLCLV